MIGLGFLEIIVLERKELVGLSTLAGETPPCPTL